MDRDQFPLSPREGLFVVGAIAVLIAAVALSAGFWWKFGFGDALDLIGSQLSNPELRTKNLSWGNWQTIPGIAIMLYWVGGLVNGLISLVRKKTPKFTTKAWEGLLKQPYHKAAYHLLGIICAETIVFAWLPFSLLYPVWPRLEFLVMLIVISSFLFTLRHVRNFPADRWNYAHLSVQMILGVTLSLVYLEYGFKGSLLTHAVYDVVPFTLQWFGFRVKDSGLFD